MDSYEPPLEDFAFTLEHVVGYPAVAALPGFEHADLATVLELLAEAGDFMAKVVAPSNRAGDETGARLLPDGTVATSPGFAPIYQQYVAAGWGAVPLPEDFGGGGFPRTVGLVLQEMMTSANMAFSLCPLLTQGAIEALLHYGDPALQATFLPKMVSGEWTGTMNLTEPQAGSDVGALTTRAVPQADGSYALTGQKIFITYGDHDLAEQIVHLVLARTPGAPAGTRGISCFIVPKFLVHDDGTLGARNQVTAVSLEHKMGIHGSPTCVMAYDGATGYLIGEEHRGLRIMFVMMNSARLSVGMQGLAVAERAYQRALAYAQERHQGLAPGATGASSAIIDFPDVRRMLLTQRASLASLRSLLLLDAVHVDLSTHAPDPADRARAAERVALLTPICKAYGTDLGNELTSLALQIQGGMGFIEETGAAQHVRDVRIAAIYEGTNGIQAEDLVLRKLGIRDGAAVREFLSELREVVAELTAAGPELARLADDVATALTALDEATAWMLQTALRDPASALAGSSPYLRLWGVCLSAWLLARGAVAATRLGEPAREQEQVSLARFFIHQVLPQASGLARAATAGAAELFTLDGAALGGALGGARSGARRRPEAR